MTAPVTGSTTVAGAVLPAISSRDEQKIRAAKAAVDSLTVRQDKASDERKAIAKKKAEDLKARIQMLKMSMPANPEAVGRLIAQLARELGAAVKSYGGTGSGLGAATDATAAAPAAGETAGAAAAPEAGVSAAAASAGGSDASAAPDAAPDPAPDPATEAATGATPKDPYRQAMAAQEAGAADSARKSAGAREDSEFAATVKQLLAELKAMAAKAAADAKASGDPNSPGVAEAGKALDGVEAALGDAGLSGGMVSLVV